MAAAQVSDAMDALRIAQAFASALDEEDYNAAANLLAPDCVYESRTGPLRGKNAVLNSYSEAGAWVRANVDRHAYEHLVRSSATDALTAAELTFIDHLVHAGVAHTFRCQQHLEVGASGLIEHIQHHEVAGERGRLEAWLACVGLARRG